MQNEELRIEDEHRSVPILNSAFCDFESQNEKAARRRLSKSIREIYLDAVGETILIVPLTGTVTTGLTLSFV